MIALAGSRIYRTSNFQRPYISAPTSAPLHQRLTSAPLRQRLTSAPYISAPPLKTRRRTLLLLAKRLLLYICLIALAGSRNHRTSNLQRPTHQRPLTSALPPAPTPAPGCRIPKAEAVFVCGGGGYVGVNVCFSGEGGEYGARGMCVGGWEGEGIEIPRSRGYTAAPGVFGGFAKHRTSFCLDFPNTIHIMRLYLDVSCIIIPCAWVRDRPVRPSTMPHNRQPPLGGRRNVPRL